MRRLLALVTILAGLYAGYWVLGSSRVETAAREALASLEADGWAVRYASLDTAGFPSRFDTTVTDLSVASPDGRLAWAAPFVQVLALSYRPNQVIAVFPPEQSVEVGGQSVAVAAEGLRASATVGLATGFPLDHAAVESGPATVSGPGWDVLLDRLLAALRSGAEPGAYDLWVEAGGLRAGDAAPGSVRLDATVALDGPLGAASGEAPPRLRGLRLREARLAQGVAALVASGDLVPDGDGFLEGTVTLRVERWRDALALLEAAGLLVFDQSALLAGALEELAGGGEDIEIPLTFRGGRIAALGLDLLAAPRVL